MLQPSKARSESEEALVTAIAEGQERPYKKKASKKQKRERQRTFRNREFFQVFTSVSSSGFADAHLDNCTVRKIQKRPVWVKEILQ